MSESLPGYFAGGMISGAISYANLHYPVSGGYVWNLFDTASTLWYDNATPTTTNGNFIIGNIGTNFPTYSVSQIGNYQIRAIFDISSILGSNSATGNYEFNIIKNNVPIYSIQQSHMGSTNVWKYISINAATSPIPLSPTDIVSFQLRLYGFTTNNFTASVSNGSVYSLPVVGSDTFYSVTSSIVPFISGSVDTDSDGLNDTLVLSNNLSLIHSASTFHPEYSTGSFGSSSLYSKYGDVNYGFSVEKGDLIVLRALNSSVGVLQYEYHVVRTYYVDGNVYIKLSAGLPAFLNLPTFTTASFEEVLFLREFPDETMVLLDFKKKQGATSYGFLIPDNLHPDVLKNIDAITQQVKTKLIEINRND